jgi:hypothetical protein
VNKIEADLMEYGRVVVDPRFIERYYAVGTGAKTMDSLDVGVGLLATLSAGAESYTPELLQAPLLATTLQVLLFRSLLGVDSSRGSSLSVAVYARQTLLPTASSNPRKLDELMNSSYLSSRLRRID